jgi:hypothetical protein
MLCLFLDGASPVSTFTLQGASPVPTFHGRCGKRRFTFTLHGVSPVHFTISCGQPHNECEPRLA